MRVQATKLGYYDDRRVREGQVFDLFERPDRRKRFDEKTKKMVLKNPSGIMPIEQQFSDHQKDGWMRKVNKSVQDTPSFSEAKGTIANQRDDRPELQPEAEVAPLSATSTGNQDANQEVI